MVIFRNYQWGAEKRNSIFWYDNNFVGTELDPHLSYAKVAEGCGLKGVTVKTQAELTAALKEACEAQKKRVSRLSSRSSSTRSSASRSAAMR